MDGQTYADLLTNLLVNHNVNQCTRRVHSILSGDQFLVGHRNHQFLSLGVTSHTMSNRVYDNQKGMLTGLSVHLIDSHSVRAQKI